jgi:acyl-CoA-binding protein
MGVDQFDNAQERVWDLPKTPAGGDMLELYKL